MNFKLVLVIKKGVPEVFRRRVNIDDTLVVQPIFGVSFDHRAFQFGYYNFSEEMGCGETRGVIGKRIRVLLLVT
jgi:hypothetical protein